MPSSLTLVTERYPQLRGRVARLYQSDEPFQELCDELADCLRAVGRLEGREAGGQALCREYNALCQRLEAELLRRLREAEATG